MSFNTEFDYTPVKTKIVTTLPVLNARVAEINNQISSLNGITGFDSMSTTISENIADLQQEKTQVQNEITRVNQLALEIFQIEAMSAGNKQTLYNFWVACGNNEPKVRFMARICYNKGSMLTDADIVALANNATLSSDQKCLVGCHLCTKYQMDAIAYEYIRSSVV